MRFMSTENKPESPKEGEEKRILQQGKEYQKNLPSGKREHFTGYIDGATAELHNTSQSYNDYLNEKEAELQSLRDQLAQQKYDNENAWKGVKQVCAEKYELELELAAKSEEIKKLKWALKELIPMATLTTGKKTKQMLIIDRAKELLNQ